MDIRRGGGVTPMYVMYLWTITMQSGYLGSPGVYAMEDGMFNNPPSVCLPARYLRPPPDCIQGYGKPPSPPSVRSKKRGGASGGDSLYRSWLHTGLLLGFLLRRYK